MGITVNLSKEIVAGIVIGLGILVLPIIQSLYTLLISFFKRVRNRKRSLTNHRLFNTLDGLITDVKFMKFHDVHIGTCGADEYKTLLGRDMLIAKLESGKKYFYDFAERVENDKDCDVIKCYRNAVELTVKDYHNKWDKIGEIPKVIQNAFDDEHRITINILNKQVCAEEDYLKFNKTKTEVADSLLRSTKAAYIFSLPHLERTISYANGTLRGRTYKGVKNE